MDEQAKQSYNLLDDDRIILPTIGKLEKKKEVNSDLMELANKIKSILKDCHENNRDVFWLQIQCHRAVDKLGTV